MSLRLKLALTVGLGVIPLVIGLAFFGARRERQRAIERLAEIVVERMDEDARARCQAQPGRFARSMRMRQGPAGHIGRAIPLDATYKPPRPRMPAPSPDLVAEMRGGAPFAFAPDPEGRRPGALRAIVRMPWADGPCANLYVFGASPAFGTAARAPIRQALWVGLATALVALLAAVPIVARVRKMTRALRAAEEGEALRLEARNDELGALGAALSAFHRSAKENLEAAERREQALRDHLANSTHDLMIPLTVLRGYLAELERDEAETARAATVKKALEESHYIAGLIRNLNAEARLQSAGEHGFQSEVDLVDLVERVASRHAPLAQRREIELNHAVPPNSVRALGDTTLLEQAVSNLVSNAIRYGDAGGHVALVLEANKARFTIRVLDDGPGIAPEELSRLTERGYRADAARSRDTSGQGLGLAITSEVARRHGFSLSLSHGAPRGLVATIEGPSSRIESS